MQYSKKFNLTLLLVCFVLALALINFPQIRLDKTNDFLVVVNPELNNCSATLFNETLEVSESEFPPNFYETYGKFEALGERKNYVLISNVDFNQKEEFGITLVCNNEEVLVLNNSNYNLYLFDSLT